MQGYEIAKKMCLERSYLNTLPSITLEAFYNINQQTAYFDRDLYTAFRALQTIVLPLEEYREFRKRFHYHSSRPSGYFLHHRYDITITPTELTVCGKAPKDKASVSGVVIPPDCLFIPRFAFANCEDLVYALIPEWVQGIGAHAFAKCEFMPKITLPDSVTVIGEGAFEGCRRLYKITLGKGVKAIGSSAFAGCSVVDEIVLPDGLTSIKAHTFAGCHRLHKVVIPDSVTDIAPTAFLDCARNVHRRDRQSELVIHCSKGSFAARYAAEHGIQTKDI